MYLITFDIIDSKKQKRKLVDLKDLEQFFIKCQKEYKLLKSYIEIHDGDQIRLITHDQSIIIKVIFDILTYMVKNSFKVRVFITKGDVILKDDKISKADGEVFYKNIQLEKNLKADKDYYLIKQCSIRYMDDSGQSSLIDILFLSLSKICLFKYQNIETLYEKVFKQKTQKEIAKLLNISETAVSKRLKMSDEKYLKQVIKELEKLLGA